MQRSRPRDILIGLVTTILIIATPVGIQASASARATFLPRAYTGGKSFSVRPHHILLSSAEGGLLVIHWSTWTSDQATGTGTSYPDHGHSQIKVQLSDNSEHLFLHMTVSFRYHGKWDPERLELAEQIGDSNFDQWATPSWVNKTGESGLRAVT